MILEQTGAYIANLKEDAILFDGWLILQLLQLGRIQIFEASMIIAAGSLHLCALHRFVNTERQGKHAGDQKRSQYDGTDDSEIASTVGFEAFLAKVAMVLWLFVLIMAGSLRSYGVSQ